MQKIISIHQPNLLPWLGYFYKIAKSDVFVILDNVDFQSGNANSITNRTKIKTSQGELWLTIPVKKTDEKLISRIQIDQRQPWAKKQLKTIQMAYSKASHFAETFDWITKRWNDESIASLSQLNILLIKDVAEKLELKTEIVVASEMNLIDDDKNGRLIEICKKLNGTIYLSGNGAKKYNDENLYQQNNITIKYPDFKPTAYNQLHGEFLPGLSIVDVLMNCSIDEIKTSLQ